MKQVPLWERPFVAIQSCRRESAQGYGYAAKWFARRLYYRYAGRWMVRSGEGTSADRQRELTVVVPACDKDVSVLAMCLRSARDMIRHRIAEIVVVAPESQQIREITASAGCRFVLEDLYLPRKVQDVKCRGWLLQQIIKFNAAFHVATPDYLVLDSDTVFLRPQTFFRNGKNILRYSDQYELLYDPSLKVILGHGKRFPVSFVAHHMVLNVAIVKALLQDLEKRFNRPWHDMIVNGLDHRALISFSEYELYGNFVCSNPELRKQHVLEYWYGKDSTAEYLSEADALARSLKDKYNSISFHRHTQ